MTGMPARRTVGDSAGADREWTREEMRSAVRAVRTAKPVTLDAEADLRDTYRGLVSAAWRQGEDRFLYDVWAELVDHHRPHLHRGFFLDQWDYLEGLKQVRRTVAAPSGRELRWEALEAFVSLRIPGFARILDAAWVESPASWRDEIGRLLARAATREAEGRGEEADLCRRTAESLMHLHNRYWRRGESRSSGWEAEARADFQRQLGELAKVDAGRCSGLYDPAELPRPGGGNAESSGTSRAWVSLLCYLLLHAGDRFQPGSLEGCAASLAAAAGVEAETVVRLLRHWAALSDTGFVSYLLGSRLGDRLELPAPAPAAPRKAFHGCDHWILLAGDRQVGKSSLLFASEHQLVEFDLLSTDGRDDQVGSLREIWREGIPQGTESRWKTQHLELRGRIRRPLCQFNLYDLPGEEIQKIGSPGGSIEQILNGLDPSSILLVFDLSEDVRRQAEAYLPLLHLVEKNAAEKGEAASVPPIYFVLNKVDLLLEGLDALDDLDPRRREELTRHFDAAETFEDGSAFFGLRREGGEPWDPAELRRRALADPTCRRNPTLQARLLADLSSLEPLLAECGRSGVRDLSLVYTSGLCRDGAGYPALTALWRDLAARAAASTESSRREHLETEILGGLNADAARAEAFPERARVEVSPALFLSRSLVMDALARSAEDLRKLRAGEAPSAGHGSAGPSGSPSLDSADNHSSLYRRLLSTFGAGSGIEAILDQAHRYEIARGEAVRSARTAIGELLEELGIPAREHPERLEGDRDRERLARGGGRAPREPEHDTLVTIEALRSALAELAADEEYAAGPAFGRAVGEEIDALAVRLAARCHGGSASYESVPYDARRGAETTLCAYRDRPATYREQTMLSGGETVLDVAAGLAPGEVPALVELMKNHSPRYALSVFRPYEKNAYRRTAVERTAKERRSLEKSLTAQLQNLLSWLDELEKAPTGAEIRRALTAEYLWQVLEGWEVQVGSLERNPGGLADAVAAARKALGSVEAGGAMIPGLKRLWNGDEEGAKKWADLRLAASAIFANPVALDRGLDVFEVELGKVESLIGDLTVLRPALERETDLELFFRLSTVRVEGHQRRLEPYAAARLRLVVAQLTEYLRDTGWIPEDRASFLDHTAAALQAGAAGLAVQLDGAPAAKAAVLLADGLRGLCADDSLWRPDARAGEGAGAPPAVSAARSGGADSIPAPAPAAKPAGGSKPAAGSAPAGGAP